MSNPMVDTEKLKLESDAVMNETKLENNPLNVSLSKDLNGLVT